MDTDTRANIDSIQVEARAGLVSEIRRLIIAYRTIFRDPPLAIIVNCYDHLSLGVTLSEQQRHIESFDSRDNITLDGVSIYPKMSGLPEILPAYDHISHVAYLRQKDDQKLWPLLTGA